MAGLLGSAGDADGCTPQSRQLAADSVRQRRRERAPLSPPSILVLAVPRARACGVVACCAAPSGGAASEPTGVATIGVATTPVSVAISPATTGVAATTTGGAGGGRAIRKRPPGRTPCGTVICQRGRSTTAERTWDGVIVARHRRLHHGERERDSKAEMNTVRACIRRPSGASMSSAAPPSHMIGDASCSSTRLVVAGSGGRSAKENPCGRARLTLVARWAGIFHQLVLRLHDCADHCRHFVVSGAHRSREVLRATQAEPSKKPNIFSSLRIRADLRWFLSWSRLSPASGLTNALPAPLMMAHRAATGS